MTAQDQQKLRLTADVLRIDGAPTLDIINSAMQDVDVNSFIPTLTGPWDQEYPRKVRSIHQIEVTSKCNLRCKYCPSPQLPKLRGEPPRFMTDDDFNRSLKWAKYFEEEWGTQGELSITGIGETLLHPNIADYFRLARKTLPHNDIVFSTNGILLKDKIAAVCAEENIGVFISLHRPEKAGHAIQVAKKHGILRDVNHSAATNAFDWAGQVDWFVSAPEGADNPCEYLRSGWGVVLADGNITTCCLDASNKGIVAHVNDDIGSAFVKPYSLCSDCHMSVP